jgi:hypothetical protein
MSQMEESLVVMAASKLWTLRTSAQPWRQQSPCWAYRVYPARAASALVPQVTQCPACPLMLGMKAGLGDGFGSLDTDLCF